MKGSMQVLDVTGDTKVIWDSQNEDETLAARNTFNSLKKKGYIAHSVSKDGKPGKVISEFDPLAESLIMQPMMAGG